MMSLNFGVLCFIPLGGVQQDLTTTNMNTEPLRGFEYAFPEGTTSKIPRIFPKGHNQAITIFLGGTSQGDPIGGSSVENLQG